jgi:hypothetical protein
MTLFALRAVAFGVASSRAHGYWLPEFCSAPAALLLWCPPYIFDWVKQRPADEHIDGSRVFTIVPPGCDLASERNLLSDLCLSEALDYRLAALVGKAAWAVGHAHAT